MHAPLQFCIKYRLDVYVDESQGYMKYPCAGTYIKICESWRCRMPAVM